MPKWPLTKKASPVLPLETIIALLMAPMITVILTAFLRHYRVSSMLAFIDYYNRTMAKPFKWDVISGRLYVCKRRANCS
jgi:hypothetical protein